MNQTQKLAMILKSKETLEILVCETNSFQSYMDSMVEVEQGISDDIQPMDLETLMILFEDTFEVIEKLLNESKELLEGVII